MADKIPENKPSNKEPAEGSRETVEGGGIGNRPDAEERDLACHRAASARRRAMRNDARPIGHDQSPVPSRQSTVDSRDPRNSVAHGRESHVVNRGAQDNAPRDDADTDPALPTGDSTLRTNI